jgi:hypothetical protein
VIEERPASSLFARLGTLSHNRAFTKREWLEYGGTSRELKKLKKEELVQLLDDHRSYYPTRYGWRVLDAVTEKGL